MRKKIAKEIKNLQTTRPFTYQFIYFIVGDVIIVSFSFLDRKEKTTGALDEINFLHIYLQTPTI